MLFLFKLTIIQAFFMRLIAPIFVPSFFREINIKHKVQPWIK